MAAQRMLDDEGNPIPHSFEDLGLWAWRCATCMCVGHGMSHAQAVERGLNHLDDGCLRPRFKVVR